MLKFVFFIALIVSVVGGGSKEDSLRPAGHEKNGKPACDVTKMQYKRHSHRYEERMSYPCLLKLCSEDGLESTVIGCPRFFVDTSGCALAALQRERCYMRKIEKGGIFPFCCTKWMKICYGDKEFDPSDVQEVPQSLMDQCFPQEAELEIPDNRRRHR